MLKKIIKKIRASKRLKSIIRKSILIPNQTRPRRWVVWFVNPLYHKKGCGACIRKMTRIDVVPWNKFNLGENSTIEDFTAINNGVGDVIIGNNTRIGLSNTIIGPTIIGNDVRFAQNIVLSALNHNYKDTKKPIYQQGVTTSPIIIEDNVWIGANSVLLAGVLIGKNAVVAAGSIVTKNVPPLTLVAGNPARVIKQYNAYTNTWNAIK